MGAKKSRSWILGKSEALDPQPGGEEMVLDPKLSALR